MSKWQEQFAAQYKRYAQSILQPSGVGGLCPLDVEFEELLEVDHKFCDKPDQFRTAMLPVNRSKNRNEKVLPNEETMIELEGLGHSDNTYINANYFDGISMVGLPFNYIATQAPLENTVGDFWRMIAECSVHFIINLASEAHCALYWPTHRERIFKPRNSFTVQLVNQYQQGDVITRELVLTNIDTGMKRDIMMFQYVGWPEEGVPRNTVGLMQIIYKLGTMKEAALNPLLVHCGAGVGRTGVFVAMHIALGLFSLEKEFSVKRIVYQLKYHRTGMVKTKLQYQFLVMALCREFQKMVLKHQQKHAKSKLQSSRAPSERSFTEPIAPIQAVPNNMIHDGQVIGSPPRSPVGSPLSPVQQMESFQPQYVEDSQVFPSYIHLTGQNPVPASAVPPITQPHTLGDYHSARRISPSVGLPIAPVSYIAPPAPDKAELPRGMSYPVATNSVLPVYPKYADRQVPPPSMVGRRGPSLDATQSPVVPVGSPPERVQPSGSNLFEKRIHETIYNPPPASSVPVEPKHHRPSRSSPVPPAAATAPDSLIYPGVTTTTGREKTIATLARLKDVNQSKRTRPSQDPGEPYSMPTALFGRFVIIYLYFLFIRDKVHIQYNNTKQGINLTNKINWWIWRSYITSDVWKRFVLWWEAKRSSNPSR